MSNGFSTQVPKELFKLCQQVARDIYDTKKPSEQYADRVARLLFMTMAHESDNFAFRRQRGCGLASPIGAWGIMQTEWGSMLDSFRALEARPVLRTRVLEALSPDSGKALLAAIAHVDAFFEDWENKTSKMRAEQMEFLLPLTEEGGDLLSVILARLHYLRNASPVPASEGQMAEYAKFVYNTARGKASSLRYLEAYKRWASYVIDTPQTQKVDERKSGSDNES